MNEAIEKTTHFKFSVTRFRQLTIPQQYSVLLLFLPFFYLLIAVLLEIFHEFLTFFNDILKRRKQMSWCYSEASWQDYVCESHHKPSKPSSIVCDLSVRIEACTFSNSFWFPWVCSPVEEEEAVVATWNRKMYWNWFFELFCLGTTTSNNRYPSKCEQKPRLACPECR